MIGGVPQPSQAKVDTKPGEHKPVIETMLGPNDTAVTAFVFAFNLFACEHRFAVLLTVHAGVGRLRAELSTIGDGRDFASQNRLLEVTSKI